MARPGVLVTPKVECERAVSVGGALSFYTLSVSIAKGITANSHVSL